MRKTPYRSMPRGTLSSHIEIQQLLFSEDGAREEAFEITFMMDEVSGCCRCTRRRIRPVAETTIGSEPDRAASGGTAS